MSVWASLVPDKGAQGIPAATATLEEGFNCGLKCLVAVLGLSLVLPIQN